MARLASNYSIEDLIRTPHRFFRSTQLDRDFADPQALEDYCLTGFGLECLASIAEGFGKNSSRRAWRFTGDYGTGKSSFALLLARCAQSAEGGIPKRLLDIITKRSPVLRQRSFVPLLVVGSREPMGRAILRQLSSLILEKYVKLLPAGLKKRVAAASFKSESVSDSEVVELVEAVNAALIERCDTEGLLLILDEAGKFLEHAALHPESQDVLLFQKLAEHSSRSGSKPILTLCLFHVAFGAYASQLSPSAQKEWDKVAGRYEEIAFRQPLEEIATLVASSLRVDVKRIPETLLKAGEEVTKKAQKMRWFGAGSASDGWKSITSEIFPLDPLLLPVALRIFQRFGQNERSLFNFLFSHEIHGLRSFAARKIEDADWLRMPQFFDYVRANFGQRLTQTSYRSHWPVIEAVLDASVELPQIEQETLKCIGLLNLINAEDLRPTEEVIVWATGGSNPARQKAVTHGLRDLLKANRIFFRGPARGYCLWPYSSVDLDKAYDDARQSVSQIPSMAEAVQKLLAYRPLVARRHYIETGSLRYFEVEYVAVRDLSARLKDSVQNRKSDGSIIIALCEDEAERATALKLARHPEVDDDLTLIGVTEPLRQLQGFVLDAKRWEWVSSNTPELNSDRYAREEVARQVAHVGNLLSAQLANFVGLERASAANSLQWFYRGERQRRITRGGELLRELSAICFAVFGEFGPRLHNELLNRQAISAAAAGARIRLIERLLEQSNVAQLGMPQGKHPPEMSMYLSVLRQSRLHQEIGGDWRIRLPAEGDDPANLRHSLGLIKDCLQDHPDKRIALSSIYEKLGSKPYGVRKGVMPLLIAVLYIAHAHEIAFYERGTFVPEVTGDVFLRLTKVPELFELQWCRVEGLRAEVLEKLREALALPTRSSGSTTLLEIVSALCGFAARLPEYGRKTRSVSAPALTVREALLSAREPVKLLLYDLPEACGLPVFEPGQKASLASAQTFVRRLHECLRELEGAYLVLLKRLESRLQIYFRTEGAPPDASRVEIGSRASRLQHHVRESRLVAFCKHLSDTALAGNAWIEALGSQVVRKPPSYWVDSDEIRFETELADLCGLFLRVENLHIGDMPLHQSGLALRVAVTHANGAETAEVIHVAKEDEFRLPSVRRKLAEIFEKEGKIALAAAAQELGRLLQQNKKQ